MRNLGFCLYFFSFTQTTCNNLCEYFFNLLQLFLNFFLTFLNLFQSYSYMYIHVLPFFSWPPRAWPKGGGTVTGCVTCHTCHSCMTDFRPIFGNPMEVTHVTSLALVYSFPC